MNIRKIIFEKGKVLEFQDLPANSVALDGSVRGPQFDAEGSRYSFDHHGDCLRMVTRATCEQVMDARRLGFNPESISQAFVNHTDIDSVMSGWAMVTDRANILRKDVSVMIRDVGAIDSHGLGYTGETVYGDSILQLFADYYEEVRLKKGLEADQLREWYFKLLQRVEAWVTSGLTLMEKAPQKERSWEITHTGKTGWVMVKSEANVFDLIYGSGANRAIAYQQLRDGSFRYTVGKQSDMVGGFPVGPVTKEGTILYALNQVEPGWGGGSSIGGSPRKDSGGSSDISPDDLFQIVERLLGK